MRYFSLLFLLLLSACKNDVLPMVTSEPDLSLVPVESASQIYPVIAPINPPDGLRPCCAFGYNLGVSVIGIPLPVYQIGNIVEANKLGTHHYSDSLLDTAANLLNISDEQVGHVYTVRGGFLDIAHIRDTADNTFYLFSQIYPRLGQAWQLELGDELAKRQFVFTAFTPPSTPEERYTLSAYLAAQLAFQMAAWHEIAQWYGLLDVPGFSEEVSGFSPEDLYSNLLGSRLALTSILQGHAGSLEQYQQSMTQLLPKALEQLGAEPSEGTKRQFMLLDGKWWDSQRRVPEKYLVLYRNYDTSSNRIPSHDSLLTDRLLRLSLPDVWQGVVLNQIGEFRLLPGDNMERLPVPDNYWTVKDFSALAEQAQIIDESELRSVRTMPESVSHDAIAKKN
ncbi:DUF4056 domain-containing protein [Limnobaculum xujianqingii]|uniref:DUF4056 domain-containing protein n=1 Tax=Limnobaculum xujianqingii TaxID=2738837 RepID=UPI00112D8915|nr:DUF4056 domain-containing protein [Limnobaculum xujianqingii]